VTAAIGEPSCLCHLFYVSDLASSCGSPIGEPPCLCHLFRMCLVICFADDLRAKTRVIGFTSRSYVSDLASSCGLNLSSRSSVALASHLLITCQTTVIELLEFVVHASKANKSMQQCKCSKQQQH